MPETPNVLDAHVHVWQVDVRTLTWLPAGHPLRRDMGLQDLWAHAGEPRPDAVLVQADPDPGETAYLLDLAARHSSIRAVVGWTNLFAADAAHNVHALADEAGRGGGRLVGVRCPAPDRDDPEALADRRLRTGVAALADRELAVELLVGPQALRAAADLALDNPGVRFVVDHLGLPRAGGGTDATWRHGIEHLAGCPNVVLKASGIGWISPDPAVQTRYLEDALALFGPRRLVYGSDWPLSTLHHPYPHTAALLRALLPPVEAAHVLGLNGAAAYRIGAWP